MAILWGRPGVAGDGVSEVTEAAGQPCLRVDAPIGADASRSAKMCVTPSGKPAQSVIYLHAWSETAQLALVSVDLHTGRTHQIRVHCRHLGAPLANDEAYGPPEALHAVRARFEGLRRARPLLHAWSMEVAHPQAGSAPLAVCAPLPPDMLDVVTRLWPSLGTDPAAWPFMSIR